MAPRLSPDESLPQRVRRPGMIVGTAVTTVTLMGLLDFGTAVGSIFGDLLAKVACVPGKVFVEARDAGEAVGTVVGQTTTKLAVAVIHNPDLILEFFPGTKGAKLLGLVVRGQAFSRSAARLGLDRAKDYAIEQGYEVIAERMGFRGDGEEIHIVCDLITQRRGRIFCVDVKSKREDQSSPAERYYQSKGRMVGRFFIAGLQKTSELREVEMEQQCMSGSAMVACSV